MASGVPKRREGGVAAVIYNLGQEMERFGHEVCYVFLEDLVPDGSVSARFRDLVFSSRLAKYIIANRSKFSVVNLHAPAGVMYGLRRQFQGGKDWPPYVMTLHGLEERRVTVMKREARKGRAWNFGWKNRAWHRIYHLPRFRWSIRTADGIHTHCRDTWNILQLNYGVKPGEIEYICSGVEKRFFVDRKERIGKGPRLLFVGTWLDQRGIFYLRDALANLAPRLPELTLTIVGPGTPKEVILSFLGSTLAPRVTVMPTVPADRMPEIYRDHDIFVFPSLMEGLPTVLLEAMAAGMPVITTETCGMPDIIENEFNGLLIRPADASQLEEAIVRLATSPAFSRSLGEAARESMQRRTWERSAHQLERLFQQTVQRHS